MGPGGVKAVRVGRSVPLRAARRAARAVLGCGLCSAAGGWRLATAFAGRDPNWGRLLSSAGAEAARRGLGFAEGKTSLWIGDALIAENVSIRDQDHRTNSDIPYRLQLPVSAPVRIGSNVWVGAQGIVLKGVTIGENAVIGAGAVVVDDVAERTIVVGVPARPLSERTRDES